MFKTLRIKIFNWFAAGRMTLTTDKSKEYTPVSTYTMGAGAGAGVLSVGGYNNSPKTSQTMTIKITPANGGTIVELQTQEYNSGELHIIPDGADFDRELGKIITIGKLKS